MVPDPQNIFCHITEDQGSRLCVSDYILSNSRRLWFLSLRLNSAPSQTKMWYLFLRIHSVASQKITVYVSQNNFCHLKMYILH
jgi:hypothetical protein